MNSRLNFLLCIPTLQFRQTPYLDVHETGSRPQGPIGGQLTAITQEEIKRAGLSTTRDIIERLPQNFGGGATGERQGGNLEADNVSNGTTINLRGLGSVATLVLLNGRRIPAGGDSGATTDISTIPVAAIERVEVLPDGASAVYGSDAVAGVVNFIMRRDFDGFETTVRYGSAKNGTPDELLISQVAGHTWTTGSALIAYEYFQTDRLKSTDRSISRSYDLRRFGGADYRTIFSNPGNIIDPATGAVLFAIPPNQNGRNLSADDLLPPSQANLEDPAEFLDLFPKQKRHNIFATINQEINENIDIFAEARFSRRETWKNLGSFSTVLAVPPQNPYYIDATGTGAPVFVAYDFNADGGVRRANPTTKNYGGVVGATFSHPNDWQTDAYASYSRDETNQKVTGQLQRDELLTALNQTDPNRAFNPFGSGSNNSTAITDSIFFSGKLRDLESKVLQAQVISGGTMLSLFGNDVRFAAGLDVRQEKYQLIILTPPVSESNFKREVGAAFAEIRIPFVTEENSVQGLHNLELSASVRHERYNDKIKKPTAIEPDTPSTTDPRFGLLWSPMPELRFQASYGTSFRAPNLSAMSFPVTLISVFAPDPMSPTGRSYTMAIAGARPDLNHETAKTWTLGAEVNLPVWAEPRLRANYFNIRFKDQIVTPTFDLTDPMLVMRNRSSCH